MFWMENHWRFCNVKSQKIPFKSERAICKYIYDRVNNKVTSETNDLHSDDLPGWLQYKITGN